MKEKKKENKKKVWDEINSKKKQKDKKVEIVWRV